MDKRTDVDRPADTITPRDRAGQEATYGDRRAIGDAPFTDDTAPDRETAAYVNTRATVSANESDRTAGETARSGGKQRTPDEIERDIERTRAEMSDTIDEIEERLSPQHIKREIRDSFHETVDSARERLQPSQLKDAGKRAGRNMFEAIKENPLPAVVAGLGIAWWMRSANDRGGNDFRTEYATRYPRGSRRYDYMEEDMYDRPGEQRYYEGDVGAQEQGGESRSMASQARGKASQMTHQAGERMHDVADRASNMAHRASDRAGEFTRGVRHRAERPMETIRENPLPAILPIPALLIGAGVLWWMTSSRDEGRRGMGARYYPSGPGESYGYIEEDVYYRSEEPSHNEGTSASGSTTGQEQGKASQMKNQASERASNVADRASSAAQEAQRQMYRTGREVQFRARRATSWMDELMHENPIAAAALMLGAGALLGLALPTTRKEIELMGPTRDHLMSEAKDMARGYAERAEHIAGHATQEVRQSVKEVAKTVAKDAAKEAVTGTKEEAREQPRGGGTSEPSSASEPGSTPGTSGTSSRTAGQMGGPSGSEGSTSGQGSQADRNKSGSKP